jgi:hypothetical protein
MACWGAKAELGSVEGLTIAGDVDGTSTGLAHNSGRLANLNNIPKSLALEMTPHNPSGQTLL